MKMNGTIKICFVICMGFLLPANDLKAQTASDFDGIDISGFLNSGSENASTLMGNYLNPLFVGFGYGANGGWYNTAKTHKPGGFDLSVTVSAAQAPQGAWNFAWNESDYTNLSLVGAGLDPTLPTLFGESSPVGNLEATITGTNPQTGQSIPITTQFAVPEGIDYDALSLSDARGYVPFLMIQGGVGLFKNTDLKIRWVPTSKPGDVGLEVGMFGLGIMHDFKQWIPGIKHIPIDLSVLVGYNRLYANMDVSSGGELGEHDNQEANFSINTLTYQILISKKISFLTVYGGFGMNQATTSLEVIGDYDIEGVADTAGLVDVIRLTDPVDEEFTSNGFRGTLGMRLKFAVLTIHADYTLQEYNTISAGVGISLR